MIAQPICKDCSFYFRPYHAADHHDMLMECKKDEAINLITGTPLRKMCWQMRADNGPCGPQGLLFEAKSAENEVHDNAA